MIVQRMNVNAKKGRILELIEFLKEDRKRGGYNYRLYQSNLGTFEQVSIELEFDDLAAHEKFWAEWNALPETPAFFKKWDELTKSGGTNEIWSLIE
mgnify:CR=1 FL=1